MGAFIFKGASEIQEQQKYFKTLLLFFQLEVEGKSWNIFGIFFLHFLGIDWVSNLELKNHFCCVEVGFGDKKGSNKNHYDLFSVHILAPKSLLLTCSILVEHTFQFILKCYEKTSFKTKRPIKISWPSSFPSKHFSPIFFEDATTRRIIREQ